jgi:hypothetical protein
MMLKEEKLMWVLSAKIEKHQFLDFLECSWNHSSTDQASRAFWDYDHSASNIHDRHGDLRSNIQDRPILMIDVVIYVPTLIIVKHSGSTWWFTLQHSWSSNIHDRRGDLRFNINNRQTFRIDMVIYVPISMIDVVIYVATFMIVQYSWSTWWFN